MAISSQVNTELEFNYLIKLAKRTSGLGCTPRPYTAQQHLGHSDKGIKNAISGARRIDRFIDIDLARQAAPDVTTLLNNRCLIELVEGTFGARLRLLFIS